jgi:hypothetical protein
LKSLVYHEIGHLFYVPSYKRVLSKDRINKLFGHHCTEENCVMNQSMEAIRIKKVWFSNNAKLITPSFCGSCSKDLMQFFKDIRDARSNPENVKPK